MSGDYTRFTFDARKRYSGVLMQQGRVQLDADWNEAVDVFKRRVRTQALDTFGPVGVPYLTTPDAFLIGALPGPDLSIEPGRIYVDGLLAELFEDETATYLNQPFLPLPPPLPAGDAVVYLDVWEREITYIEDAELLDVALGGADTATRTQTVWRVRVEERPGAACGQAVGEARSAGRLTTAAIAPPAPDDPCILPPITGYRGLENRLYRVEIHEGGALGAARFKWSRDNGSIVSVVTELVVGGGDSTLTVNRIGRDQVSRFRIDDWVTVTDDHRELMGMAPEPARIVGIDEAARHIVLDRALPIAGAGAFATSAADLAARHTRIQRWDQTEDTNTTDGDGLIGTAAGPIAIEQGIEISFSMDPAGSAFRTGDYWVFAARVADASVEELIAAPPRGIVHHYAQLAAITGLGGADPQVHDCRPPRPEGEECCCTFVVAPGESIQAAIDDLPPQGGCVCLIPGIHAVSDGLRIPRSNVTLKCESDGAIVRLAGDEPVLFIGNPAGALVEGVLVSRVEFEREGREQSQLAFVVAAGVSDTAIEDCEIRGVELPQGIGVFLSDCRSCRVERCAIGGVLIGIVAIGRTSGDLVLNENRIDLSAQRGPSPGLVGVLVGGIAGLARIEANTIGGALSGIIVNEQPAGVPESIAEIVRVAGNRIACAEAPPETPAPLPRIGIDLASRRSVAADNVVFLTPRGGGTPIGIRLTSTDLKAAENAVSLVGEGPSATIGIQIGFTAEAGTSFTSGIAVCGNSIAGCRSGIAATNASLLDIGGNRIDGGFERAASSFGITLSAVSSAQVHDNQVGGVAFAVSASQGRSNRFAGNDLRDGSAGLFVMQETGPIIAQNRIEAMGAAGIAVAGILGRCDVVGNRVTACGFGGAVGYGVLAYQLQGELHAKANEIMDTGLSIDGGAAATTAIGLYGLFILEAGIEGNLITYSKPESRTVTAEDRALLMQGLLEVRTVTGQTVLVSGFPVAITNNKFIGTGQSALVELRQTVVTDNILNRFERVFFSNNYCMHFSSAPDERFATVTLVGRAATVMGNQVKATTPFFSFHFNNMPGPYIGNITRGGVLQHADFPLPEGSFNLQM
jgi:nitrous oxidase accessory protein NosD